MDGNPMRLLCAPCCFVVDAMSRLGIAGGVEARPQGGSGEPEQDRGLRVQQLFAF